MLSRLRTRKKTIHVIASVVIRSWMFFLHYDVFNQIDSAKCHLVNYKSDHRFISLSIFSLLLWDKYIPLILVVICRFYRNFLIIEHNWFLRLLVKLKQISNTCDVRLPVSCTIIEQQWQFTTNLATSMLIIAGWLFH